MFVDYYSILEIEYPSSPEEIKKSYRRLSLKWHPDKHLTEDTSKKMVEINEAYFVLKDAEKKSRYDAEYVLFHRFKEQATNSQKYDNNTASGSRTTANSQYQSYDYRFHNTKVEEDIRDAHKAAKDLVDEFLKQFKESSKNAAKGAWGEMWPYIIIIIISPLFLALIRSCQ
ncbi:MAG: DnaJ domain-containing protein [Muribaculum sp.]|nr:DnaJ domain-containing protein [Muribaculum sp.]